MRRERASWLKGWLVIALPLLTLGISMYLAALALILSASILALRP